MATPVNDRDVLIMGTTPRYTPPTNRAMIVSPPAAVFKLSADGKTASPSSCTFTANMINVPGTVTWSSSGGISLSVNGNTATLNFASFSAVSGTVTASITVDGQVFTSTATVTKVADGAPGVGTPGQRGTINTSAATAGAIWSDSDANAAIASAGGASPMIRDVVTLYNQAASFTKTKFYDGSAWQDLAQLLDGGLLVNGSVIAKALGVGSVTASKIAIGLPDNIVPDPQFRDLSWWNRVGTAYVGQWSDNGQTTNWLSGASMYLGTSAGELFSSSKFFPIEPGATYLIRCQVGLSSDFNGRLSVFMTIPSIVDFNMTGQGTNQSWSDNMPVQMNSSSAKGLTTFTGMYTVPRTGIATRALIQLRNSHTAGTCEVGGISITRVTDATILGPGIVQTKHLGISQGGDISNGQTGYNQGVGFWFNGAGAGYGPRFSLGDSNGAHMAIDPFNGVFDFVGPKISSPTLTNVSMTALSFSGFYDIYDNGPANQAMSDGWNVTPSGGDGAPYTVSFSISAQQTAGKAISMTANGFTANVTAPAMMGSLNAQVTCTVADKNGRSISQTHSVTFVQGNA